MPAAVQPQDDRNALIDALRAIALYGVISFNIVGMVGALVGGSVIARANGADMAFLAFDLILIQGKARAAFALLFGVGFGTLAARAAANGQPIWPLHSRRMLVLLAIGLANLAFLFFGDILILYALLGLALPLFRNLGNRALVATGLALLIVPPLVIGLVEAVTGAPLPNIAGLSPAAVDALMPATAPIYQGNDYAAFIRANLAYYVDHYRVETGYALMYDLSVFGLFLIGVWAARNRVLTDVAAWRPFLIRTAAIAIPLGLVLSIVHASRRLGIEADGAAYGLVTAAYAGLALMSFGYVALFSLWLAGSGQRVARALAPTGRMALTGYLASNAIGAATWYGWGLGLMGQWNGMAMNLFALAIFLGLCLFSTFWLRAFRHGPVEWLWRSLAYGAVQPMRRRAMPDLHS
ncbi:uncharacterized protein FHS96_000095 [Sphingomonas zeicaulis]|uniref:DUF418 domain-containing protein n=1 Tax=Sphingomonas zeicaulis TaxID=1632740 RepID=UPI003D237925